MKIPVTGGAGFIESALIYRFERVDIWDRSAAQQVFTEHKPDVVMLSEDLRSSGCLLNARQSKLEARAAIDFADHSDSAFVQVEYPFDDCQTQSS